MPTLSKFIVPNQSLHVSAKASLLELSDHCVSCGMCLPACPTYSLANVESESPRGRISLIKAILEGHIEASAKAQEHLEHCLLCRRCERICPANVSYAELMDGMRDYLQHSSARKGRGLVNQLIYKTLRSRKRWFGFLRLGSLLERTGLLAMLSGLTYGRINADLQRVRTRILPLISKPVSFSTCYPAVGETLGEVSLFTGCLQEWAGQDAIQSAITVLTHMGYKVHIPVQQQCCGAMHMHGGHQQQACELQMQNRDVFQRLPVQAIIGLSSACVVGLTENTCDVPVPAGFKVFEFCDFIANNPGLDRLSFQTLNRTVLLHLPCTHRNVLRKDYQVEKVLHRVPGLNVVPLPADSHCCGAAGIYMLDNPDVADKLGMQILKNANKIHVEEIVTTNIGCSLHFRGLLLENEHTVRLAHPAEILSEAINKD